MKKSITTIVMLSTIILSPTMVFANSYNQYEQRHAHKQEQDHKEELGFGIGAVIGGIIAGPAGAFITGLAGSLMAKDSNAKENINELEVALANQKSTNKNALAKYQQKLQSIEQNYQRELLALESNYQKSGQLQAENLLMSLQFSTGSSVIKPHYQAQIKALANLLQQSPQLSIDLSGYTDLQGSEELNQTLSQARAQAVKTALVNYGIATKRIKTEAYGESSPVVAKTNKEVSFYDRRVVIKLHANSAEKSNQMAKN